MQRNSMRSAHSRHANKYVNLLLIVLPLFLLIGAFYTSAAFDAKLISIFDFLHGISPLYWSAYYFIVGVLIYFGYALFVRDKEGPSESLALFYILVFAFAIYFVLLLFTNPLVHETARYGKVYHILKEGTLEQIPPLAHSVGNSIFWSTFISITSLDGLPTLGYIAPIFLWVFTVFCIYSTVRSVASWKLAFIGTLFCIGASFQLFNASRYSFAAPLFALFIGSFLRYLRADYPKRSIFLIVLLLFAALTISHPVSLFALLMLLVGLALIPAYTRFAGKSSNILVWERLKNVATYAGVLWLSWFVLRYSMLPGSDMAKHLWDMLTGGMVEAGALITYQLSMEPLYRLVVDARIVIGMAFLIAPLILSIYLSYKLRDKTAKQPGHILVVMLGCYAFFLPSVFLGSLNSTAAAMRTHQYTLFLLPALLALIVDRIPEKRTISKLLLCQIGVGLGLIVFLLIVPNLTYVQQPSEHVAMVEHFSAYGPYESNIYGMGPIAVHQHLFSKVYASRGDIRIYNYSIEIDPSFVSGAKLSPRSYIFVDGSAVRTELKYVYDPPISTRIGCVQQTFTDHRYDKIYASSPLYSIWLPESGEGS